MSLHPGLLPSCRLAQPPAHVTILTSLPQPPTTLAASRLAFKCEQGTKPAPRTQLCPLGSLSLKAA